MGAASKVRPLPHLLDRAIDSTANVWIRYGDRDALRQGGKGPQQWVVTLAQQTASPHLYLTPAIVAGALSGGWTITHGPTGDRIPTPDVSDLPTLLRVVTLVADLDWSGHDVGHADKPHTARFKRAVDEVLGLPSRVQAVSS